MLPLNPETLSLDWANARACAEVCALVYNPPCSQPGKPAPQPGDAWIEDPRTDAHAVVQERDNCIVVCFRGSKDAEDYIQDGKFAMEDLGIYDGNLSAAYVHEGFLEDFEALYDAVVAAIKKLPRKAIFVTGHSLGAGQATLCALELDRKQFPIAGIYTFGSPRVGNGVFCKLYDQALGDITFRVINQNDIVPRVPPLINGYRHCENCIFLPACAGATYWVNPSIWRRAISNCLGFWGAFRSLHDVLVTDHHIGSYQKRIQLL